MPAFIAIILLVGQAALAASTGSTAPSTAAAAKAPVVAATPKPAPPPKVFVDKGACPLDCCVYQEWTVEKETDLLDAVDGKKVIAKLKPGFKVTGVTGEVHVIPLRMRDKTGHEIYLLTPQGDELWKIWENGRVVNNIEETWPGKPKPKSTWWVQVRMPNGFTGWSNQPEHFADIDSCK